MPFSAELGPDSNTVTVTTVVAYINYYLVRLHCLHVT